MFNWQMFPFTKMNAINLDWILAKFNEVLAKSDEFDAAVAEAEAAADRAEDAAASIVGEEAVVVKVTEQDFTNAQKLQARENINAASDAAVVKVTAQSLSSSQQETARENIAAAADADVVKVVSQSLTSAQQAQARGNIDVLPAAYNKYKIFNGVGDVGFEAGAAATTVEAVYNAMGLSTIVLCDYAEFPSSEFPANFAGMVCIVKRQTGRGYVLLYGKETKHGDYRKYLNSENTVDSTWYPIASDQLSTSTASQIATAGSGVAITAADFVQSGCIAQVRLVLSATSDLAAATKVVATIAAGKRPVMNALATFHLNETLVGYINSTNGGVNVKGAISNGTTFTVYSTYILGL